MKYRTLIYFLLILSIGFSQKVNNSFSVFDIISNSNPNFGPDEQRYNWKPVLKNVLKSTRIDTVLGDTLFREYDNRGNLIQYKSINSRGWCHKFNYQFDQNDRLIKETSVDCNGKISYSLEITYTDTSIIKIDKGRYPSKVEYTLDSSGRKIKRQDFIDNRSSTYWLKEYNENGHVIDFKFFWSDTLTFHEKYMFGKHNELLESRVLVYPYGLPTVYDFYGCPIISFSNESRRVYKYDEPNNQITEYRIWSNKDTITFNYIYDHYGNIIEINKIENNKLIPIESYSYLIDEYGNIIERKSYRGNKIKSVRKTKYEYSN